MKKLKERLDVLLVEKGYFSSREKDTPIISFKDWLDQLIRDILVSGVNNDIIMGKAWALLGTLKEYKDNDISADDYEKMILIAEFVNAKCIEKKKESMRECMRQISYQILNSRKRLELVRVLADMKCEKEIFDICLTRGEHDAAIVLILFWIFN